MDSLAGSGLGGLGGLGGLAAGSGLGSLTGGSAQGILGSLGSLTGGSGLGGPPLMGPSNPLPILPRSESLSGGSITMPFGPVRRRTSTARVRRRGRP